jgi:hypothetical protein
MIVPFQPSFTSGVESSNRGIKSHEALENVIIYPVPALQTGRSYEVRPGS